MNLIKENMEKQLEWCSVLPFRCGQPPNRSTRRRSGASCLETWPAMSEPAARRRQVAGESNGEPRRNRTFNPQN